MTFLINRVSEPPQDKVSGNVIKARPTDSFRRRLPLPPVLKMSLTRWK